MPSPSKRCAAYYLYRPIDNSLFLQSTSAHLLGHAQSARPSPNKVRKHLLRGATYRGFRKTLASGRHGQALRALHLLHSQATKARTRYRPAARRSRRIQSAASISPLFYVAFQSIRERLRASIPSRRSTKRQRSNGWTGVTRPATQKEAHSEYFSQRTGSRISGPEVHTSSYAAGDGVLLHQISIRASGHARRLLRR